MTEVAIINYATNIRFIPLLRGEQRLVNHGESNLG